MEEKSLKKLDTVCEIRAEINKLSVEKQGGMRPAEFAKIGKRIAELETKLESTVSAFIDTVK